MSKLVQRKQSVVPDIAESKQTAVPDSAESRFVSRSDKKDARSTNNTTFVSFPIKTRLLRIKQTCAFINTL